MLRPGRPQLKRQSINALLPNAITVLALFAGLTAIRYGLQEQWDKASIAILVAGICDGLDGRLARLLKSTSRFGAELDSLSDFVSFGVAPALVIYQWTLHQIGGLGWAAALVFATCSALRLARFNTALDDPNPPPWQGHFFTGVPAPAGGGLALVLMFLSFELGDAGFRSATLNAIAMLCIGFLMISRLPTFSLKKMRLSREMMLPALIGVAVLAAALINFTWWTLALIGLAYLVSVPFSVATARRMAQEADAARAAQAAEPPAP